ncbi:MAG: hypothetical protein JW725_03310 [Candidatus Babeliaceae bacterium]|nr:hypothetical protein [Candidatus Babeliaceae bacterium]
MNENKWPHFCEKCPFKNHCPWCPYQRKHQNLLSTLFTGIALIFVGISFLLNTIWKFEIPIFSLLGGIFLIYLGFVFVIGNSRRRHCCYFDQCPYFQEEDVEENNKK